MLEPARDDRASARAAAGGGGWATPLALRRQGRDHAVRTAGRLNRSWTSAWRSGYCRTSCWMTRRALTRRGSVALPGVRAETRYWASVASSSDGQLWLLIWTEQPDAALVQVFRSLGSVRVSGEEVLVASGQLPQFAIVSSKAPSGTVRCPTARESTTANSSTIWCRIPIRE